MTLIIMILKLLPLLPGANELMGASIHIQEDA